MLATDRSCEKLSAGSHHGSTAQAPQLDDHCVDTGPIEQVRQALRHSAAGQLSGQDRSALAGSIDELSRRLQRLGKRDQRFREIGFSPDLLELRKRLA